MSLKPIVFSTFLFAFALLAHAETETEAKQKVRYKEGQDINFEKLLIQGQLQKPNLTVITGEVKQGGDGLLRIRKDFLDRMAEDFGEDEK